MPGSAEIVAAGAVVARRGGAGPARPPSEVRRLVLPEGQARPGRARARRRGARGRRGDGARHPARPPLSDRAVHRGQRRAEDQATCTTGSGRVDGDHDVSTYRRTTRSTRSLWLPLEEARAKLTYDYDRGHARGVRAAPGEVVPVVVLRHGRPAPGSPGAATTASASSPRPASPGRAGGPAAGRVRRPAGGELGAAAVAGPRWRRTPRWPTSRWR